MKELLEKLYSENEKLSLLLLQARKYAQNAEDEQLLTFIENELNGYSDQELPDYRKIKGEIIATIQDAYGQIITQNYPIDFSRIIDELGLDITVAHVLDGIGFLEDALAELTGQMAKRPIPIGAVKELNKIYNHNYPEYYLRSAAHNFPKAAIQFILTSVRQRLILALQKLDNRRKKSIYNINSSPEKNNKIKVFVTYAWEDENHNDKIISFVDFLRRNGYEATMDRKKSGEESAINFNEMMITGIKDADKVIVVLSKKYKEKAGSFTGGVGFEFKIIVEELKSNNQKFIFVTFGNIPMEEIIPIGIKGREILDLKKDQDESNFQRIFAKLQSQNTIKFSEVSETVIEVEEKEIKPFKL